MAMQIFIKDRNCRSIVQHIIHVSCPFLLLAESCHVQQHSIIYFTQMCKGAEKRHPKTLGGLDDHLQQQQLLRKCNMFHLYHDKSNSMYVYLINQQFLILHIWVQLSHDQAMLLGLISSSSQELKSLEMLGSVSQTRHMGTLADIKHKLLLYKIRLETIFRAIC